MTTPTHRELLEGAARAAGIEVSYHHGCGDALELVKPRGFQVYWNPLTDDGDALRLAVKLRLPIEFSGNEDEFFEVCAGVCWESFYSKDEAPAATRLAITRAAFDISKGMR